MPLAAKCRRDAQIQNFGVSGRKKTAIYEQAIESRRRAVGIVESIELSTGANSARYLLLKPTDMIRILVIKRAAGFDFRHQAKEVAANLSF